MGWDSGNAFFRGGMKGQAAGPRAACGVLDEFDPCGSRLRLAVGDVPAKYAVYFSGIVVACMFREPLQHVGIDMNDATEGLTPILRGCLGNIPQVDFILAQFGEPRELMAFSRG